MRERNFASSASSPGPRVAAIRPIQGHTLTLTVERLAPAWYHAHAFRRWLAHAQRPRSFEACAMVRRRARLARARSPLSRSRARAPVPGARARFQAVVDPYARADVFVSFERDSVNVEEAYLPTLTLPAGLQLKAGKFGSPVGRINQVAYDRLPVRQSRVRGNRAPRVHHRGALRASVLSAYARATRRRRHGLVHGSGFDHQRHAT